MERSRPLDDTHARRSGEDRPTSQPDEKSVLDDAGHFSKSVRERARIRDCPETGVENDVSLIRDENMAVSLSPQLQWSGATYRGECPFDPPTRRGEPEVDGLNGQWVAAETLDYLPLVGDDDHIPRCGGHDLFAQ
jgi:hypothetical protein